ncbi:hypothetical protein BD414DRAFT_428117 [Trametes punicea]|nr:hypothetical protein BD414DRAFT_428117 [Trametes punicea]
MSRYPPTTHYSPPAIAGGSAQDSAILSPSTSRADNARHERESSLSDSETSTSLNAYAETVKDESNDPYLALTSQTLNADGTPKRPMNAFMIFARKRRPQISAANQMMRTGDVSKILSKEWNTMDMSEKKFYLDQAKKLKDNFNSKYPDYVYRRRPNNSRKKRKPEATHDDAQDASHLADPDDPAYEDTSPIDPDDAIMIPSPQEVQYTRAHALNSSSMYHVSPHDPSSSSALGPSPPPPQSSAACTYPYSTEFHNSHSALPPSRLPHLSPESALPGTTVRPSPLHDMSGSGMSHGYSSQSMYQTHGHSSSMYAASGQHATSGLWDPTRAGVGVGGAGAGARSDHPRSNWPILPALDISLARQRSYPSASGPGPSHLGGAPTVGAGAGANGKSEAYSPQLPTRPWSSATSSTASSSSSASTSQHYGGAGPGGPGTAGNNAFPTLSSAFFPPGESPGTSPASAASAGHAHAHAQPSSHDYYSPSGVGSLQPGPRRGSMNQEHASAGGYAGQYAPSHHPHQQHQHQHQHHPNAWSQPYSRAGGAGTTAGSLHQISPYTLQASPGEGNSRSVSGSSAHSAAPLGFWDDRYGGR